MTPLKLKTICGEQLSQLISTVVIANYGMSERIRNSKIRNKVVANFLSILRSLSCRLSLSEELIGPVMCFRSTQAQSHKTSSIR